MQSKHSLDLIPHRWLEYEPPSLCHEPITATLAALGIGEAAAGTAAAGTAAIAEAAGSTAAGLSAGEAAAAAASLPEVIAASAPAASSLPSFSTLASVGGPVLSAGGTLLQAKAQGDASAYQEALLRAKAADEEAQGVQAGAVAQQRAIQSDRQLRYVMSKRQADLAASGTAVEGPDEGAADIAGQGQYNILASILGGEGERARYERQAGIDLFGARNAAASVFPAQAGTVLAGLGSFLNLREQRAFYKKIGEAPTLSA